MSDKNKIYKGKYFPTNDVREGDFFILADENDGQAYECDGLEWKPKETEKTTVIKSGGNVALVSVGANEIKSELIDEINSVEAWHNGTLVIGPKIKLDGCTTITDGDLVYDQDEAIEFIQNEIFNRPNTELHKMLKGKYAKESLRFILDAEEDYMRSKGIIED